MAGQWQCPSSVRTLHGPHAVYPVGAGLLARAALHAGERVLDVACGTGIVARLATQRVGPSGYVMGVDLNAAMIETARTQTPPRAHPSSGAKGMPTPYPVPTPPSMWCVVSRVSSFPDKPHALREDASRVGPWRAAGPERLALPPV